MRTDEHIDAVRREGELLATAVEDGDLSAPITYCPNWTVADLVRHIGVVHRRVAAVVRDARAEPPPFDPVERTKVIGPVPDDDASLLDWFRDGHGRLVETLRAAPADLECWTFIPSPRPLAFWARRQAHETAIHRLDAQQPLGRRADFSAAFAADGVDELLIAILGASRGRRGDKVIKADSPVAMQVHASDTGQHWTVRLGPNGVQANTDPEPADCLVTAAANVLYPLLWNRLDPDTEADAVIIEGDPAVFDLWRKAVTI
jgi:uncharacterized protein (TIGR03083 family)